MTDEVEFEQEQDAFTWMTFKFKTIRVLENMITANYSTLKAEVIMNEEVETNELGAALEKIHFWFNSIVNTCILFNRDNDFALGIVFDGEGRQQSINMPMALPGEPTDNNLAIIFQAKLNALGGNALMFGGIEITTDSRENLTCAYGGIADEILPSMEEWVGERAYHDVPWWFRDDGTTIDIIPAEGADLEDIPEFGFDLSFIEDKFMQTEEQPAIVIRPTFTPKVISGGLDNDNNPTKD